MVKSLRICLPALLLATISIRAQEQGAGPSFQIQPGIGVQTMWFNGDYPVRQDISPGLSRDLPLGGGVLGPSNGLHLQLEVIPDRDGILRFPISADAFFLSGKTTFAASRINEKPTKRWTFTHSGNIFSVGAGVTASFFKLPHTMYLSFEGKVNFIPSTSLVSHIYNAETGETIEKREFIPDSNTHVRYGAYLKLGTQVEFFQPFILDFSVGYGGLNLGGKDTNPETQRNLLVVDNRNATEVTLGYVGVGLSIIWRP